MIKHTEGINASAFNGVYWKMEGYLVSFLFVFLIQETCRGDQKCIATSLFSPWFNQELPTGLFTGKVKRPEEKLERIRAEYLVIKRKVMSASSPQLNRRTYFFFL